MEKYKSRYLTYKKLLSGGNNIFNPFIQRIEEPIIVGQIYYFQRALPKYNYIEFLIRVLNEAHNTTILTKLDQEYTDGGFQLPHNTESNDIMNYNILARTHTARQLIFVINKNLLIGLQHKDNIINWNNDEIKELLKICNEQLSNMNIPFISVVPLNNVKAVYNNNNNISDELDDINFYRYKHYKIKFNNPINIKDKDKLIKYIIKKNKNKRTLRYIYKSDSPNGGFCLPMTSSWKKYAKNLSERELMFIIKSNKITGLRFADDISLWTNDEVDKLLESVISFERLNKKNK
jgi:hypothetical protein